MKTCLISTVGISLYNWIVKLGISVEGTLVDITEEVMKLKGRTWKAAEISSIDSILENHILDEPKELWLLTSDTREGKISGELIKEYYKNVFETVHTVEIPNLNAKESSLFRDEGLRQLVQTTSQIIYMKRDIQEECIINATGGFKAQISFVGLIGQVLKIPVYYQFEDFSNVIKLPSMPISLDYQLWLKYFQTFDKLYRYGFLPEHQMDEDMRKENELRDLFDISEDQYRLSSVGLLMHEVLLQRFTNEGELYLPKMKERTIQHEVKDTMMNLAPGLPLALTTMLDSIVRQPYVEKVIYIRVKENFAGRVDFKRSKTEIGVLEGTYSDGRHTWYFHIYTTANQIEEEYAICVDLSLRFSNPFEKPKPGNVEFILIRHGQHTGEAEKRIEGWADFELTETGKEQATLLAEKLKTDYHIDFLYSSSLTRARQTADIIGKTIGLQATKLDDLKAMNYGLSGGLTKTTANVLFPKPRDMQAPYDKSWGRESDIEFSKRVLESFYEIYYTHPGEQIAIVTHGRAINVILREVLHLPVQHDFRIESDDTSIHHVQIGPNQTILYSINNTEHLHVNRKIGERV
ncbi:TPA: histidine phosphatase family protein [Bacillus paranthracis]